MLDNRYDLNQVLAVYPPECRARQAIAAGGSGLSGSLIWRLETAAGPLCLRCWPEEHPTIEQLEWIHTVLQAAWDAGFDPLPLPIRTSVGATFVRFGDSLWELSPWLPGEADIGMPSGSRPANAASAERIEAALAALAQFHTAVQKSTMPKLPDGPPPGLVARQQKLIELQSGGLANLVDQVQTHGEIWPQLAERASTVIDLFRRIAPRVEAAIAHAVALSVRIQPCIRDIHREHVLFEGSQVTGIIDFGAMQPDCVSGDIARLLGSMAGDDRQLWQLGLASYQRIAPPSAAEISLVPIYEVTGVLLSPVNWLRWIFVEHRQFADRTAVLTRFDTLVTRLAALAEQPIPIAV